MISPMSLLAQSGYAKNAIDVAFGGKADMPLGRCLLLRSLLGVKRTCLIAVQMSAFDPKRTSSDVGRTAVFRPSSLLRRALGRRVGRQRHPGMARFLPNGDARRRESRVREVADGNHDGAREAVVLPVDGRPTGRTEMKGQGVAAFSRPRPRRGLAGDGNLLTLKARLVAHHGSGAALAGQAVTHRDARWLALDRQVQLRAAARCASAGHELSPPLNFKRSVDPRN